MNIQLFADVYDEMIGDINRYKEQTQTDLNNLTNEKQNALDNYEQTYQNQLTNYDNLMNQQKEYIDTWANTQKETQQKQTDYNIGLIEQNKQEAEKQTNIEKGNAYIDYQKGLNQFGGSAETLASQGLGGTGFAKNQDIAMNITYQNRVSAANSALQQANTQYNNQIQQALLTNDAALAEIALKQMEQSYQLALQGFEYKTTMENNRLSYIQNLNDTYFSKTQTLQNRLDTYNSTINSIKQAREEANLKKQQIAEQAALERQQMAWEREKFYTQLNASNLGSQYSDTSNENYPLVTQYYKGNYNKDAMTNGKVDKSKVFSNGYQPNNVNGTKVEKTGMSVAQAFGSGQLYGSTGASLDSQNVWKAGSKYYVWDGSQNKYIDVSSVLKNALTSGSMKIGGSTITWGSGGGTHSGGAGAHF